MDYQLLAAFIVYSLFILAVGVWGYRKETFAAYAVAERSLGTTLATGSFVATFLSAITVIGTSGYASRYGWSAVSFVCYGTALGWILLVVAAKKMHQSGLTTVPELLRTRYESVGLGTFSALAVISLYSITLIVQLLGVAIALNTLIGFAVPLAILLLGAVFVTYTVLGGLTSVVRTDMIQAVLMGGGVLTGAIVVLWKTNFAVIHAPPEPLSHFFGGEVSNAGDLIGWALVWGLGIPTQSYYLHRFYASRDTDVARKQVAFGGIIIMLITLSVIICGVGAGMLIPEDQVGDSAFPYMFKNVIGGWVSLFILLAITASVHSTTDGLLHVVGLYFAVDVYQSAKGKVSQARLLGISRRATLVFGLTVTLIAAYVSLNPFPLIQVIAGIAWGGMASTLFVPLFFGLFWRRATRAGAIASSVGGFVVAAAGFVLKQMGLFEFHEIYPGVIASLVLMVGVSLATRPNTEHAINRFFVRGAATV